MTNATMTRFGWPETRVAEFEHWAVMLRPQQPTAGALVVACKEPATAFSRISAQAFAEFGSVVAAVEGMLARAVGYDKVNWLMLMMVDPHVHFHVLPRHETPRTLAGLEIADAGWPGPPALGQAVEPDAAARAAMIEALRAELES